MSGSINQLRTVSNSGEIKSSHTTMGISDAWTQPLWVVTDEITYKRKDRLKVEKLDAPHSFTKTIKHSVVRTWATIEHKPITIQPLTKNFSNHELATRTFEPFLPRNRKTRANKLTTPCQTRLDEHPWTAELELWSKAKTTPTHAYDHAPLSWHRRQDQI